MSGDFSRWRGEDEGGIEEKIENGDDGRAGDQRTTDDFWVSSFAGDVDPGIKAGVAQRDPDHGLAKGEETNGGFGRGKRGAFPTVLTRAPDAKDEEGSEQEELEDHRNVLRADADHAFGSVNKSTENDNGGGEEFWREDVGKITFQGNGSEGDGSTESGEQGNPSSDETGEGMDGLREERIFATGDGHALYEQAVAIRSAESEESGGKPGEEDEPRVAQRSEGKSRGHEDTRSDHVSDN